MIAPDGDDPQTGEVLTNSSVRECRAFQEHIGNRTMTKTTKKTQTASRPPFDALQYEKLALSAFGACDRQIRQLRTLIDLAASITRCPATTVEERRSERNLLEHLLYTVEQYQQEVECDRDLYQVIALDAKGVAHSRITAKLATKLLSDAAEAGREAGEAALEAEGASDKAVTRKQERVKAAACARADAQQTAVKH
ncbi:hypothetical protein, partial [Paraburkholderia madseniana]